MVRDAKTEAKVIALDIETFVDVPPDLLDAMAAHIRPRSNIKDIAKIEADILGKRAALLDKAALSPLTARVVSWAICTGLGEHDTLGNVDTKPNGEGEYDLLHTLDRALAESGCVYLATKYGRKFDLPFIAARMALRSFAPTYPLPLGHHRTHLDIHDVMPESLGLWAVRFGMAKTASGDAVDAMVRGERFDELLDYNKRDAQITWEIGSRLLPIMKG